MLMWQSDEHGTYNLHVPGSAAHIYIQPRRPYCDRGHWQINWIGLRQPDGLEASMYFHRLETAIAEADRWVQRGLTGQSPSPDLTSLTAACALRKDGLRWAPQADGRVQATVGAGHLHLEITPQTTSGGTVWVLDAQLKDPRDLDLLDDSDRFPRVFLDPTVALDEAACFAQWRLTSVPIEHPVAIALAPRPAQVNMAAALIASAAPSRTRSRSRTAT